ncbi:PE-PPE domain protein (fragment) [uncultured Mycobacterium sp.]|uniref:PE-PPE domain protein n=1 Tax=uncultured Mycobacterium sp. TaxID=171292 RepID=A0A1Y5PA31_9MYCO
MNATLRTTVCAVSALIVAVVVAIVSTVSSVFAFVAGAATTVLVMGGTGHSLSSADTVSYVQQFVSAAVGTYVSPSSTTLRPTGIPAGPYNGVALITPEEHAPDYGTLPIEESIAQGLAALDSCLGSNACDINQVVGSATPSASDTFVVFGYSQSATISTLEKAALAAQYGVGEGPDVSFVLIGAGNRPNGGLSSRIAPSSAPLTNTQYATVDIAVQYDGIADAPLNPMNLLADLNAYMGMLMVHPNYMSHSLSEAGVVDQGQYGDTT